MVRIAATVALTALFWVVPSANTRGQGTLGDRFVHADRAIVGGDARARQVLARADRTAARAVSALD
jgi:hypothetical protein